MNNNHQTIVFVKSDYTLGRTNEEATNVLWDKVSKQIQLLLEAGYLCVVRDDDVDIIVIEFENDERRKPFGVANPYWMTEEEYYSFKHKEVDENEI